MTGSALRDASVRAMDGGSRRIGSATDVPQVGRVQGFRGARPAVSGGSRCHESVTR